MSEDNPETADGGPARVQAVINCVKCGGPMDVTDMDFGDQVECPHCQHQFAYIKRFGDYEITSKLGEGGMGGVYLARDTKLNRDVALKLLKSDLTADAEFTRNFLTEAELTASLNHPNVVQVYAFGEEKGVYYLVMELISDGSLDDKIFEENQVGELEVLDVALGVANGLQAAQERNLIHRDIKPGNILFGNNQAKLVDFGLARLPGQEDQFATQIWGTPYYVAPEKLEQKPETFKADMYSLGTSLFHALTGRPPFEADDPNEVARKHLVSQVVSVKSFAPQVTTKTAQVIKRMCSRQPEDRYDSYAELIADLEDARRRLVNRIQQASASPASQTSGIWVAESAGGATKALPRRTALAADDDSTESEIVVMEDEARSTTRNLIVSIVGIVFLVVALGIGYWLAAGSKARLRSTLSGEEATAASSAVSIPREGDIVRWSFATVPSEEQAKALWQEVDVPGGGKTGALVGMKFPEFSVADQPPLATNQVLELEFVGEEASPRVIVNAEFNVISRWASQKKPYRIRLNRPVEVNKESVTKARIELERMRSGPWNAVELPISVDSLTVGFNRGVKLLSVALVADPSLKISTAELPDIKPGQALANWNFDYRPQNLSLIGEWASEEIDGKVYGFLHRRRSGAPVGVAVRTEDSKRLLLPAKALMKVKLLLPRSGDVDFVVIATGADGRKQRISKSVAVDQESANKFVELQTTLESSLAQPAFVGRVEIIPDKQPIKVAYIRLEVASK